MTLYEVVNPSDPITFRADDERVAIALTVMLGEGKYGLRSEDGKEYSTFFLFISREQIDERLKPYFKNLDELLRFTKNSSVEIVKALDTVATVDFGWRQDYENLVAQFSNDTEREKYKDEFNDRHRSSMNDIYGYSKKLRGRLLVIK